MSGSCKVEMSGPLVAGGRWNGSGLLSLQCEDLHVPSLSNARARPGRSSQPINELENCRGCGQECGPEDGIAIARLKLYEVVDERIEQQRRSQHPGGAPIVPEQHRQPRERDDRENTGGNRVAKAAQVREPELQKAPPSQRCER